MIDLATGDLLAAEVDALVNAANTHGVMGGGIALQFKTAYPAMFRAYKAACDAKRFDVGQVLTYDNGGSSRPRYIINFPTKRHWRAPSRIEYIESGLPALVQETARLSLRSIAVPALGCGLGGLAWEEVWPHIEAALAPLEDVRVLVFAPRAAGRRR